MITCCECQKDISAICGIDYVVGSPMPAIMHAVCYEKLKVIQESHPRSELSGLVDDDIIKLTGLKVDKL